MRRWNVAARFFKGPDVRWLDDFIIDPNLTFRKILSPGEDGWHSSRRRRTTSGQWLEILRHGWRAFAAQPHGIITCFPQLAMTVGALKGLTARKTKIVAYNFNLGGLPGGARRLLARLAARHVDIFVVHSPSEVVPYARYLSVEERRIRFVPLQRGELTLERREDMLAPYLLAMGSAHRDYFTLISVAESLGLRTLIVTRKDMIEQLPKRPCVEFRHGLSEAECLELLAGARLSVIPIDNLATASGQVTVVNSMMLGVAVIATKCPGTDGYLEDGVTGLLVEPFDTEGMKQAIRRLWYNLAEREAVASAGKAYALNHFSDPAVAGALQAILAELR